MGRPRKVNLSNTPELPEMPKPDVVGEAAQAFMRVITELEAKKTERGQKQEELIRAMKQQKRNSITIDGWTFERRHRDEVETVAVKKPKFTE